MNQDVYCIGFGDKDAHPKYLSSFGTSLNECSDLPHCDVRVSRSGHYQVIAATAMQSPHFVLVCIKGLHTLIGLNGPELHKAIRTATGQARTEIKAKKLENSASRIKITHVLIMIFASREYLSLIIYKNALKGIPTSRSFTQLPISQSRGRSDMIMPL